MELLPSMLGTKDKGRFDHCKRTCQDIEVNITTARKGIEQYGNPSSQKKLAAVKGDV